MTENNQGETGKPDPREIQKVRLDPDIGPEVKLKLPGGNAYVYGPETSIFGATSFAAVEYFKAGETMSWSPPTDEWQYILRGEAEVTYSLLSTLHTEERTMHVAPGDLYFIPAGARLTWKVAPGDNLVHLCIVMLLSAPREAGLPPYLKPGVMEKLK